MLPIISILGALLIGAMSPGPSFVLVARTAMAVSRSDGVAAAVGMGVGGVVFAALTLLGLHVVLTSVPALYGALRLLGGLYLLYLAVRMWRGAKEPVHDARGGERGRDALETSFLLGLLTQVSNPKTAVVYGSVFVALLPPAMSLFPLLVLPPLIFLVEAGWYTTVAVALSSRSARTVYLRAKSYIDRLAGGVMALLGVKLIAAVRAAT